MLYGAVVFLMAAAAAYVWVRALHGTRIGRLARYSEETERRDVYYCPMHPEYTSAKPGQCPVCNMTLVKREQGGPAAPVRRQDAHPAAGPEPSSPNEAGERRVLYWVDPMNPAYRSESPGKAPDGMDLVPVYAGRGAASEAGRPALPQGTVRISAEKQQLIGVQYEEVRQGPLVQAITTAGRVTYDETKIRRVHPKIEGWIEKVYADFTGTSVKKGEALLTIYSPELFSAQEELLLARKAMVALEGSPVEGVARGAVSLYESARQRLRLWDIPEADIEVLEGKGVPAATLALYSPADGFVISRNAYERQRVTPETELYTIADLSTVWVVADIYEYEAPAIAIGQKATVRLSYVPGRTFRGKISYISPQVDTVTRTLKVRVELDNRSLTLKPDMYAEIAFEIDYGEGMSVPEEAVLNSGTEQIVFVARGNGYFEPRTVRIGQKVADRFIVLGGLRPGEKVVTSGNFLIDSESRLSSAIAGMGADAGQGPAAEGEGMRPAGTADRHD